MDMFIILPMIFLGVFLTLMIAIAIWDIWKFEIPNTVSILLFSCGLLAILMQNDIDLLLARLGIVLLVFGVSAGLFFLGVWGGGDAKVVPATVIWLPADTLILYVACFSVAGGVLALGMVLASRLRSLAHTSATVRGGTERRSVSDPHRIGVPYGVALAIGGLCCIDAAAETAGLPMPLQSVLIGWM